MGTEGSVTTPDDEQAEAECTKALSRPEGATFSHLPSDTDSSCDEHDRESDSPAIAAAIRAVLAELDRATSKFPTWPTDPLHAHAILGEECGELLKAIVQATYEPHKSGPNHVRAEAIQTAAMALRFVTSLDRYEYTQCPQHRIDEP